MNEHNPQSGQEIVIQVCPVERAEVMMNKSAFCNDVDININTENLPDYLTVLDVSKILQITRATVYGWIFRRIIPHVKVGRFVRIHRKDFEEFLRLRRRGDFSSIPDGRTQTRPERW